MIWKPLSNKNLPSVDGSVLCSFGQAVGVLLEMNMGIG